MLEPTRASKVPPFVVFHPTDAAQRLWVFWARSEASARRPTALAYRVSGQGKPEPKRGGLERDPRTAAGTSRVRRSRAGSARQDKWRCRTLLELQSQRELVDLAGATVNRTTHAWGTAEMLINRPYTQCDPLPIPIATGTMLVYHANESVTYTSTVYGATETVDHRYAGSTTIDVRNTAKRALRGKFGDFQTFTSDVGQNGRTDRRGSVRP